MHGMQGQGKRELPRVSPGEAQIDESGLAGLGSNENRAGTEVSADQVLSMQINKDRAK